MVCTIAGFLEANILNGCDVYGIKVKMFHSKQLSSSCVSPLPICSYVYKPLLLFKELGIPGPKPKPVMGNLGLFQKFDVSLSLCPSLSLLDVCMRERVGASMYVHVCTCMRMCVFTHAFLMHAS